MSAPYWGELPAPKHRRTSSASHSSGPSQELDYETESQPHPRRDRSSVQTTRTDAPTESTTSPFASPTASSFAAAGLAPRPPSQTYGAPGRAQADFSDKRARRSSQPQNPMPPREATDTPPAAPDVPRGPPISYRQPPGSSTAAYGAAGPSRSARRVDPRMRSAEPSDTDAYHNDPRRPPVLDRNRKNFDSPGDLEEPAVIEPGRAGHDGRRGSVGSYYRGPARRDSVRSETQGTAWADDRSPLQRLELTLDSITKEEKRARVAAAEKRARERQASLNVLTGAQGSGEANRTGGGQHVKFRNRASSLTQEYEKQPVVADPVVAQPSSASQRGVAEPLTRANNDYPDNEVAHTAASTNLPQRNLSFRDRAVADDRTASPPGGVPVKAEPYVPPQVAPIARNGSGKLRKSPPNSANKQKPESKLPPKSDSPDSQVSEDVPKFPKRGATIKKKPPPHVLAAEQRSRPAQIDHYDDDPYQGFPRPTDAARQSEPRRTMSMGAKRQVQPGHYEQDPPSTAGSSVRFAAGVKAAPPDDYGVQSQERVGFFHHGPLQPGHGTYKRPEFLDEWKKGSVATLSGSLLKLDEIAAPAEPSAGLPVKDTAWWENGGKRRSSISSRPIKAEAFDGEYDDTKGPTRFKPQLYLKCGPLLRYCGLRREAAAPRTSPVAATADREFWRGSVMIVTQDSDSSYEIAPILRLFVQPIELLPPPPTELHGEQALLPEYVDPIAGIPKLGRRGETLYVRPIEHLEEGKDASRLEPDDGIFEITRTAPDFDTNAPDPPGSFTSRKKRIQVDGEKAGKYKDVRGFRLHQEKGCTFWRFNIEVELQSEQQRVAYRINRGPATGFWVPARETAMNVMFHSCNGFSLSVNTDEFNGPDPMWRDVLNTHQTRPFHVMVGGGDQIYNDAVMRETTLFQDWLHLKNPLHKNNAPFTPAMQIELENFYLERYCMWFSTGLFGLANSQIPMVNMFDDHDIIDGFGSYPNHFMRSPVFSGLGNVAFKYYMLFQHQSVPDEPEQAEPSWALGIRPGPYIHEQSRSLFMSLGGPVALLAVDARTERTRDEVVREETWKKLMDRCYDEVRKGTTQHILVLLGVPIAYPRLVWLETILTSRLMDPLKALGKAGMLGNFLNNFDGGVEVLDDLDDHWTAKNHKDERRFIIEDLQDLAADKSVRVTILSGDVHLAAVGQFYSNAKLQVPKHKDFRYMPNIISSAIANTPPPDLVADILNKRNKIHHFDKETDEDMIPIFTQGVDGKPRNNQRLLPHRNWCSIRPYQAGYTPPPTPPSQDDETDDESPRPGLLRRLSLSKPRGPAVRPDATREPQDRSRPPITGNGGGFLRTLSRRASTSEPNVPGQGKPKRSLSLSRGGSIRRLFRRSSYDNRADDESSIDDWRAESADDIDYDDHRRAPRDSQRQPQQHQQLPAQGPGRNTLGLRGGGGDSAEYVPGDDSYFTARPPRRAFTQPSAARHGPHGDNYDDFSPEDSDDGTPPPVHTRSRRVQEMQDERAHAQASSHSPVMTAASATAAARRGLAEPGQQQQYRQQQLQQPQAQSSQGSEAEFRPKPFHRTPTGLSAKLIKKAGGPARVAVDLEGGLEITLNVEVNPKDPAGITVPYRLIVPKLWSESANAAATQDLSPDATPAPIHSGQQQQQQQQQHGEYDDEDSDFSDDVTPHGAQGRERFSPQQQQRQSPRPPASGGGGLGGGIKRWLSNRSSGGGGGGSQYRARRGGDEGSHQSPWNDGLRM
ncbi:uncharacterized protein B0I36DRAFT_364823 [Microdochium trichocladiopsis]|uniref:PhoD-like phosphatase domain-containing protein n=1 Tax=Microdochium trichocladiopsis TaxID=1682393 RepID=A0A9P8Y2F0_9PEZI|nr:uncharacterized protein B0I36DRAFT_364823 [Microdochium trichocladiopsis]KAH7027648.1 hypothetical protein B0I36DRAFT_364823 [Microdochium trichocladiopsis]